MRICHVVYECIPGRYAGGVQKMVYALGCAQAAQGNAVEIWTIGNHAEMMHESGCRVRYFAGRARWWSRSLYRALKNGHDRFDVIHAHNTFLPLNWHVAGLARRGAGVFFHAHGALDPRLISGWSVKAWKKRVYVALVERRNFDSARAVIGLTGTECAQLVQTGTRAAVYEVSNGIDVEVGAGDAAAASFRLKNRIPIDSPLIMFIGRITPKKGLHFLLGAMRDVLARHPKALLAIGGNRGEEIAYTRALDQTALRLGLGGRVRWIGFLDEKGKKEAFAASTLFVHPSYSEGMAMAILEAMAAGVPTVVTPGCYMDAAVKAGALVEAQQEEHHLAAAINRLVANPAEALRLGTGGSNYVRDHHAWAKVVSRLALIYRGDPAVTPFRPALK